MAENCLFCKIINNEIPSLRVFESANVIGVLSIKPASKGHVILIPKEHVIYFTHLNPDLEKELFLAIRSITSVLVQAFNAEGFNIISNIGPTAGQRVPHACIHIIPRYKDDNLNISIPEKEINEEELYDTYKKYIMQSRENTLKLIKAIKEGKIKVSPEVKEKLDKLFSDIEKEESEERKKLDDLIQ